MSSRGRADFDDLVDDSALEFRGQGVRGYQGRSAPLRSIPLRGEVGSGVAPAASAAPVFDEEEKLYPFPQSEAQYYVFDAKHGLLTRDRAKGSIAATSLAIWHDSNEKAKKAIVHSQHLARQHLIANGLGRYVENQGVVNVIADVHLQRYIAAPALNHTQVFATDPVIRALVDQLQSSSDPQCVGDCAGYNPTNGTAAEYCYDKYDALGQPLLGQVCLYDCLANYPNNCPAPVSSSSSSSSPSSSDPSSSSTGSSSSDSSPSSSESSSQSSSDQSSSQSSSESSSQSSSDQSSSQSSSPVSPSSIDSSSLISSSSLSSSLISSSILSSSFLSSLISSSSGSGLPSSSSTGPYIPPSDNPDPGNPGVLGEGPTIDYIVLGAGFLFILALIAALALYVRHQKRRIDDVRADMKITPPPVPIDLDQKSPLTPPGQQRPLSYQGLDQVAPIAPPAAPFAHPRQEEDDEEADEEDGEEEFFPVQPEQNQNAGVAGGPPAPPPPPPPPPPPSDDEEDELAQGLRDVATVTPGRSSGLAQGPALFVQPAPAGPQQPGLGSALSAGIRRVFGS